MNTMKKIFVVMMIALVLIFVVACSKSPSFPAQPVQAPPTPAPQPVPPPAVPSSTATPLSAIPPAVPIEPAVPVAPPPGAPSRSPSQPQPTGDIKPIQPDESQKYLTIENLDLRRTSNDKGVLNRLNFTIRNVGSFEIRPVITITFDKGIMGQGSPTVIEQKIELPPLQPGYKINKYIPTTIRFHELNRKKTLIVSVRAKFADPQTDLDVVRQEFYPIDTLKDAEISWT